MLTSLIRPVPLMLMTLAAFAGDAKDKPTFVPSDYGPAATYTVESTHPTNGNYAYKGLVVKLTDDGSVNLCFDTETMRVSCAWTGGYMEMPGGRDGLEGHPKVLDVGKQAEFKKGKRPPSVFVKPVFGTLSVPGWSTDGKFEDPRQKNQGPLPKEMAKWTGLYLDGNTAVLSYTVGGNAVLESPTHKDGAIARRINIAAPKSHLAMIVAEYPEAKAEVKGSIATLAHGDGALAVKLEGGQGVKLVADGQRLVATIPAGKAQSFVLVYAREAGDAATKLVEKVVIPAADLSAHTKGGAPRWGKPLTTAVTMGKNDEAYTVDTIAVPFTDSQFMFEDNSYHSYMRITGLDFFADGRAAISTIDGDVWIVSDFAEGQTPKWRRFATGIFQALGLKIVDNKVHVIGRDQLSVLHDLNNDGEADFYQNLNNECIVTNNYHEFALDLQTDKEGNFFYAKGTPWPPKPTSPHQGCMIKISKDGSKFEVFATGLRAPNGLGMGPNDELTASDNQGHWMPACKVSLIKKGGFYGMVPTAHRASEPKEFDQPIFWLPMQMDNSSGGEGWVKGDKWGPFDGQMLHTSYGKGTFFICYVEYVKDQVQGGAVKLPLNFQSGVMRIRQHPIDGQIYVVGMRGWQTAGSKAGAFQRVRYTGKPANLPKSIRTEKDALVIEFTDALSKDSASPDNFAIEAWNYEWTGKYGSPENKPSDGSKGHDKIEAASVKLSPDGKTMTLGLPGLKPVNQLKIKYRLESAAGELVSSEIYYTINAVP